VRNETGKEKGRGERGKQGREAYGFRPFIFFGENIGVQIFPTVSLYRTMS